MPADTSQLGELAALWRWFGKTQFAGYSPLYEQIALHIAEDEQVLRLVAGAPAESHLPILLLAAAHYLLLEDPGDPEHPLAAMYGGRIDGDPGAVFSDFCLSRREEIEALLSTRRVQTNECGRSALLGPALTWCRSRLSQPFSWIDVGASAGLNLNCDLYRLDYGSHGASGPAESPVRIACEVVGGDPPVVSTLPLPDTEHRLGIDLAPVDLSDPAGARWLLACVWPGTGRLERTAAAIELARLRPPIVVQGDAVTGLSSLIGGMPVHVPVVVTTTWVYAYFSAPDREAFTEVLRQESARRPVVWVSAEGAGTVSQLPGSAEADGGEGDVLGAVMFRDGEVTAEVLGYAHPHGNWLDWRGHP